MGYNNFNSSSDGDETSKYGDGYLQIQRLHYSWITCKAYSTKGMLEQWRRELEAIWLELSGDAIRMERKKRGEETIDHSKNKWFVKNNQLNKAIVLCIRLKKRDALYNVLTDKEIFLRDLQLKSGKAGKYADKEEARL